MLSEKIKNKIKKHKVISFDIFDALVIKDDKEYNIDAGDSIDIPLGVKHSLQNPYDEILKIIEVQKGNYISEDDIIRYEDCYGRV